MGNFFERILKLKDAGKEAEKEAKLEKETETKEPDRNALTVGREDFPDEAYLEQQRRLMTFRTSGMVMARPPKTYETSDHVYPVPRNDGKQVCNKLRQARQTLARANFIPFEAVPCRQEEECGGSCPTCDAEAEYLERELAKIPEHRRVYPKLDLGEEDE